MSDNSRRVNMSDRAAKKVWQLIEEEGDNNLKLRVYITGGGCSGFQYGFSFVTAIEDDDSFFETKLVLSSGEELMIPYVVDPLSYQYLVGAEIDYSESLQGAHFTVKNPNAKTTCGCGSSFSI